MSAYKKEETQMSMVPLRQGSLNGDPPNRSRFLRECDSCKASFGESPHDERGIWNEWRWYCSVECAKRAEDRARPH